MGERWAKENKIKCTRFPADWKNIKRKGAIIGENDYGKFDKLAGAVRNEKMAFYADGLIAINTGSAGTADMIKQAKEKGIKVFVYDVQEESADNFEFKF